MADDASPQDWTPQAAAASRYGAHAPEGLLWHPVISGLLSHRSVRSYLPAPLEPKLVETLVAAAQSAASSSNLQLWSVVAVQDAERRAKLAELAGGQKHIAQAPLLLVWLSDLARGHAIAERASEPVEGFEFLESFTVSAIDAALAAQNAVVAAEALGLGTVYIGALRNKPQEVASLLGLPAHTTALFGLVVGWPDPASPASIKPRLPQAAVLHHEQYSLDQQAEAIAAYDETSRSFQRSQGQPVTGWIAQILARSRDAAALNGRQHLRSALNALGYKLR